VNLYPYIERKDGPLFYRTDVFPISEKGMVVMQQHKPIGYEAASSSRTRTCPR